VKKKNKRNTRGKKTKRKKAGRKIWVITGKMGMEKMPRIRFGKIKGEQREW